MLPAAVKRRFPLTLLCIAVANLRDGAPIARADDASTCGTVELSSTLPQASIGETHLSALEDYNGKLIVGGAFLANLGTAGMPVWDGGIIAWDGTTWSDIGGGVSGNVSAVSIWNGYLIAGGEFQSAGSVLVNNIAAWDGANWFALGGGIESSGRIQALAVYNGRLIAAGAFSKAGDVNVNNIAAWNGTSWSALADGIGTSSSAMISLFVHDGTLFAGGGFNTAGGVGVDGMAQWDGQSWSATGNGASGRLSFATAFAEYKGNLVAAGILSTANSASVSAIAMWNGESWIPFSDATKNSSAGPLLEYRNWLIAPSRYTNEGAIDIWDGQVWAHRRLYELGCDKPVNALAVYSDKLMVGGSLTCRMEPAAGVYVSGPESFRLLSWLPCPGPLCTPPPVPSGLRIHDPTATTVELIADQSAPNVRSFFTVRVHGGLFNDQFVQADGSIAPSASWTDWWNFPGGSTLVIKGLTQDTTYTFDFQAANDEKGECPTSFSIPQTIKTNTQSVPPITDPTPCRPPGPPLVPVVGEVTATSLSVRANPYGPFYDNPDRFYAIRVNGEELRISLFRAMDHWRTRRGGRSLPIGTFAPSPV